MVQEYYRKSTKKDGILFIFNIILTIFGAVNKMSAYTQ